MSYSIKNLREVEDSAIGHGFSAHQESRFAGGHLGAESTGLSYHVVKPNRKQAFGHRHDQAEEIYVVLSGTGRMKLDDDVIDVGPMDAIRVAPPVTRAFEAGNQALELLAFGPRHDRDGELVHDFWPQ